MELKMPVTSGKHLIKVLHKLGYNIVKQRGSHIKIMKETVAGTHSITIQTMMKLQKEL